MGSEFGQRREWDHDASLDWHVLENLPHRGVQRWVQDLNRLYRSARALHETDCERSGFEWVDANDHEQSVLTFVRRGVEGAPPVLIVCNFTPVPRHNYRVGVPVPGMWVEALNSDAADYGGSGQGNLGAVEAGPVPYHGRPCSLNLTAPPLGAVFLRHAG
jgi:1,4-alpha-glucan branching enzyme